MDSRKFNLRVETIRIRPKGRPETSLAMRRHPGGCPDQPPAFLLHGLGLSSYVWRFAQPALAPHRATIAIDLPGFGRSGKSSGNDYSLPGIADAVIALMDALDIERTAWVGHSLGGGVTLAALLMRPDRVEKAALIGGIAYPQEEPPFVTLPRMPLAWIPLRCFHQVFLREGLRQVYLDPSRLEPGAVREYAIGNSSIAGARAFQKVCRALRAEALRSVHERYRKIRAPVLIIHGERDNVVPRWVPERLASEIPDARYHPIPIAGHMLPEEETDAVCRLLGRFLETT